MSKVTSSKNLKRKNITRHVDLRDLLERFEAIEELETIEGANWNLEIAALSPALIKPFEPAFTIPDDDLIPASLSFFAVALPTPGSANRVASGSFFDLPVMSSPN